eukprot:g59309.t1
MRTDRSMYSKILVDEGIHIPYFETIRPMQIATTKKLNRVNTWAAVPEKNTKTCKKIVSERRNDHTVLQTNNGPSEMTEISISRQ